MSPAAAWATDVYSVGRRRENGSVGSSGGSLSVTTPGMSWASSPSTNCQRSPVTGSRPDIASLLSPRQARTNPASQWSKRLIDAASLGLPRPAGRERQMLTPPRLNIPHAPDANTSAGDGVDRRREVRPFDVALSGPFSDAEQLSDLGDAGEFVGPHRT